MNTTSVVSKGYMIGFGQMAKSVG